MRVSGYCNEQTQLDGIDCKFWILQYGIGVADWESSVVIGSTIFSLTHSNRDVPLWQRTKALQLSCEHLHGVHWDQEGPGLVGGLSSICESLSKGLLAIYLLCHTIFFLITALEKNNSDLEMVSQLFDLRWCFY